MDGSVTQAVKHLLCTPQILLKKVILLCDFVNEMGIYGKGFINYLELCRCIVIFCAAGD
jgi:hypothetical protein